MEDIRRVFFHELGHFIAHEINFHFYNGSGIESFVISPFHADKSLFVGEVKTVLPEGQKTTDSPEMLLIPETLAALKYGCMFQSYFLDTGLSACLQVNGSDDKITWYGVLAAHSIAGYDLDVEEVEEAHFNLLREGSLLDEIMKLDPMKYLKDIANGDYTVNLEELRKDTKDFIEKHKDVYRQLIEKYKETLSAI